MIPVKTDALTRMKMIFSRDYSTRRAEDLVFRFYSELDEDLTDAQLESCIREMLADYAQEDGHFFVEAIDWQRVRDGVQIRMARFSENIRI